MTAPWLGPMSAEERVRRLFGLDKATLAYDPAIVAGPSIDSIVEAIRDAETHAVAAMRAESPSEDDLNHLRSIQRNLADLKVAADIMVETTGFGLANDVLADNRDWLDCFIEKHERSRARAALETPHG